MNNTADELLEKAKENLKEAYSCLVKVLAEEPTWKKEYVTKIHQVAQEVRELKDKL